MTLIDRPPFWEESDDDDNNDDDDGDDEEDGRVTDPCFQNPKLFHLVHPGWSDKDFSDSSFVDLHSEFAASGDDDDNCDDDNDEEEEDDDDESWEGHDPILVSLDWVAKHRSRTTTKGDGGLRSSAAACQWNHREEGTQPHVWIKLILTSGTDSKVCQRISLPDILHPSDDLPCLEKLLTLAAALHQHATDCHGGSAHNNNNQRRRRSRRRLVLVTIHAQTGQSTLLQSDADLDRAVDDCTTNKGVSVRPNRSDTRGRFWHCPTVPPLPTTGTTAATELQIYVQYFVPIRVHLVSSEHYVWNLPGNVLVDHDTNKVSYTKLVDSVRSSFGWTEQDRMEMRYYSSTPIESQPPPQALNDDARTQGCIQTTAPMQWIRSTEDLTLAIRRRQRRRRFSCSNMYNCHECRPQNDNNPILEKEEEDDEDDDDDEDNDSERETDSIVIFCARRKSQWNRTWQILLVACFVAVVSCVLAHSNMLPAFRRQYAQIPPKTTLFWDKFATLLTRRSLAHAFRFRPIVTPPTQAADHRLEATPDIPKAFSMFRRPHVSVGYRRNHHAVVNKVPPRMKAPWSRVIPLREFRAKLRASSTVPPPATGCTGTAPQRPASTAWFSSIIIAEHRNVERFERIHVVLGTANEDARSDLELWGRRFRSATWVALKLFSIITYHALSIVSRSAFLFLKSIVLDLEEMIQENQRKHKSWRANGRFMFNLLRGPSAQKGIHQIPNGRQDVERG
ncbi:hypothetical protein ACA910_022601 [Epithemia clementina (nom. ined.)]